MRADSAPPLETLRYGQGELVIPEKFKDSQVLLPPGVPVLEDLESALRKRLSDPCGSPPLGEFVEKGDSVTLVLREFTMPSLRRTILPVVLEEIRHAGQVRIVLGLGLRPAFDETALEEMLGAGVMSSVPVFQHDARANNRLIFLGRTRHGTEISLSRFLLPESSYRADESVEEPPLKMVLIGSIFPHYFLGFAGGCETILPGCASEKAIFQNHALMHEPEGNRVTGCRAGNLAENPCHYDLLDVAAALGSSIFLVNTISTGLGGGAAGVTAGDLQKAHLSGCRYYLDNCAHELRDRFDVVLASCGGYPGDVNFISSHRAMEHAFLTVKPGGTLILAAECREGFGHEEFLNLFAFKELPELFEMLRKHSPIHGHTAYAALWKAKQVDIVLVSSLDPESVRQMSMTPASGLQEASQIVTAKYGTRFAACIMPHALDTLVKDDLVKVE